MIFDPSPIVCADRSYKRRALGFAGEILRDASIAGPVRQSLGCISDLVGRIDLQSRKQPGSLLCDLLHGPPSLTAICASVFRAAKRLKNRFSRGPSKSRIVCPHRRQPRAFCSAVSRHVHDQRATAPSVREAGTDAETPGPRARRDKLQRTEVSMPTTACSICSLVYTRRLAYSGDG